jgi:hypothetical protein
VVYERERDLSRESGEACLHLQQVASVHPKCSCTPTKGKHRQIHCDVMYLPSEISEVRIQGSLGSYHLSWNGESSDPDLPPPEISGGPYITFKAALRAARRKIRKDRRKLHEQIINTHWEASG